MFNHKHHILALSLMLSACSATQAPPYEAEKAPEDREDYTGLKGMAQYQKDQDYLMKKELQDNCDNAKLDLAVAKKENNQTEIERQLAIIEKNCQS